MPNVAGSVLPFPLLLTQTFFQKHKSRPLNHFLLSSKSSLETAACPDLSSHKLKADFVLFFPAVAPSVHSCDLAFIIFANIWI